MWKRLSVTLIFAAIIGLSVTSCNVGETSDGDKSIPDTITVAIESIPDTITVTDGDTITVIVESSVPDTITSSDESVPDTITHD